jgi:CheY-like chemotaxis protein
MEAPMPAKTRRLLLFEDDYESMQDLKEYIEEELGWQVELSAQADIPERLQREKFDLIIVDLMIHPTSFDAEGRQVENVHFAGVPWVKTGLEFLRRLRKGEFASPEGQGTSPQAPVLILSAVAGYSVTEELGKSVQFNGYIEKPFRLEDLISRIRSLVREW